MSEPGLVWLRDPHLAPLAASPWPAWAWSLDATRIVWANPTGAAIVNAATLGAVARAALPARRVDAGQPATQIALLAATLPADGTQRLERLRGLGAGIGRTLTCHCARITLHDGTQAILVAATEPAGPDLSLHERVRRLLRDTDALLAVFSTDGTLVDATPAAQARLAGARTLAALGVEELAAEASACGHAASPATGHGASPIAIDRIGSGPATVLVVTFDEAPQTVATPSTTGGRHLLRFVWQIDADGHFTLASPEFAAFAGPRTAAALGRTWDDFAAALGLDPEGLVSRALATRDTWSGITVAWPMSGPADDDGERLTVELAGLPVFDRERNFCGYRGFGVCRDLARLQTLAQQHAATAPPPLDLNRTPPDASPLPINDAACGKNDSEESVAGPPPENIVLFHVPPHEHAATALTPVERHAFQELARLLADQLTPAGDGQNDPALGGPASADCTLTGLAVAARVAAETAVQAAIAPATAPIADAAADNEIEARLSAAAATEHALAAARDEIGELHAILDTATDGVVMLDRDLRIMSANRSAQALFGCDAGEFAGRSVFDLFAPESIDVARDYIEALRQSGGVLNDGRDVIGRERQGGLIPLFMSIGCLGSGKLCAVFRDLTAWKKAEEELIEARRQAERQSSAKSDFLAKVSHEIRNPLNAIVGFSEIMMEERFGPVGNERYQQYLKDIHASGGHIMSLVDDLLDLSKIEAGKLELTFAGIALNDVILQCVALMQPQANRERIIIRTSLAPKLPQVMADARSLRQIVLNLLSNSIKFTGPGGQVIVSTARTDTGDVALRVRDTGIGMSERELATALEPFRQVATANRPGGTGLGLPLSKALAEANRAHFRIDSKPNAGTLVEVMFPGERVLGG
jgi:PAS domain S-box-containing protein